MHATIVEEEEEEVTTCEGEKEAGRRRRAFLVHQRTRKRRTHFAFPMSLLIYIRDISLQLGTSRFLGVLVSRTLHTRKVGRSILPGNKQMRTRTDGSILSVPRAFFRWPAKGVYVRTFLFCLVVRGGCLFYIFSSLFPCPFPNTNTDTNTNTNTNTTPRVSYRT
jgi:hypothetical protein